MRKPLIFFLFFTFSKFECWNSNSGPLWRGGGGGAGVRGLEEGEDVWGAAAAAEHPVPPPAALDALESAAIPYTGLTALVP